jgi:hypothetical protein
VPRWFPEVPDHEFLSFSEVCKVLPIDAQKYLVRANKLGKHRLDGGLQPYVQRPGSDVPTGYESGLVPDLRHVDLTLLYEHSQVTLDDYREGRITVTLWFPREHVDSFLGWWEPMPHLAQGTDPLPWESKPKKTGRPGEEWHDLIAGAADIEEAKRRLPALPKGMERNFTDATGERIRIRKGKDVTMKYFKDTLRKLLKKSSDE